MAFGINGQRRIWVLTPILVGTLDPGIADFIQAPAVAALSTVTTMWSKPVLRRYAVEIGMAIE